MLAKYAEKIEKKIPFVKLKVHSQNGLPKSIGIVSTIGKFKPVVGTLVYNDSKEVVAIKSRGQDSVDLSSAMIGVKESFMSHPSMTKKSFSENDLEQVMEDVLKENNDSLMNLNGELIELLTPNDLRASRLKKSGRFPAGFGVEFDFKLVNLMLCPVALIVNAFVWFAFFTVLLSALAMAGETFGMSLLFLGLPIISLGILGGAILGLVPHACSMKFYR